MAAAQAASPAPAESPAGESVVLAVAGQMNTASCVADLQSVALSDHRSSDPALSSEKEDMLSGNGGGSW